MPGVSEEGTASAAPGTHAPEELLGNSSLAPSILRKMTFPIWVNFLPGENCFYDNFVNNSTEQCR